MIGFGLDREVDTWAWGLAAGSNKKVELQYVLAIGLGLILIKSPGGTQRHVAHGLKHDGTEMLPDPLGSGTQPPVPHCRKLSVQCSRPRLRASLDRLACLPVHHHGDQLVSSHALGYVVLATSKLPQHLGSSRSLSIDSSAGDRLSIDPHESLRLSIISFNVSSCESLNFFSSTPAQVQDDYSMYLISGRPIEISLSSRPSGTPHQPKLASAIDSCWLPLYPQSGIELSREFGPSAPTAPANPARTAPGGATVGKHQQRDGRQNITFTCRSRRTPRYWQWPWPAGQGMKGLGVLALALTLAFTGLRRIVKVSQPSHPSLETVSLPSQLLDSPSLPGAQGCYLDNALLPLSTNAHPLTKG
ncbi:hypothetical protein G7046_g9581 [Stylonectria norvegica]|nr:hypothetical protein G7046_g9581 [Stylonectria norvegica]